MYDILKIAWNEQHHNGEISLVISEFFPCNNDRAKRVFPLIRHWCNIPRIKDKTEAALRRLIIVPFNARFSAKDKGFDPYIKYKLQDAEVMEYLIKIGLEGLQRILTNNSFTKSDKVEAELQEYRENNNPVIGFFKEYREQIDNEPTQKVYRHYMEYCLSNSLQPMSNVEFSKQVNRVLGYSVEVKRIGDKTARIFMKG